MEITIGSDHAGYEFKKSLTEYLKGKNINVLDLGTHSSAAVDYPDIAKTVTKEVLDGEIPGIAICGTGIGISIACNKVKGIRAALCHSETDAEMARKHNDANIICFGARTTDPERARQIIDVFLETDFEGGRHQRRIEKISQLEKSRD